MTKTFDDLPAGDGATLGECPIWQSGDAKKLSFTAFWAGTLGYANAAAWRAGLGITLPVGAIVGTSDTQTLTGKTLTSATLGGTTVLPASGSISSSGNIKLGPGVGTSNLNVGISSTTSARVQSYRSDGLSDAHYLALLAQYSQTAISIVACGKSLITTDGYDSVTDTYIYSNNVAALHLDSSQNVMPNADNTKTLGGASFRWSVVYAGTGTINTSGAETKTGVRVLNDAEIAVAKALAASTKIYQFCDAVEAKGDAARLHVGLIYEDVVAAFKAQGLDPERYGIVCKDPATKVETTLKKSTRPKTQKVTRQVERLTIADGKAVLALHDDEIEEEVTVDMAVLDADGNPVVDKSIGVDEEGEPTVIETPRIHQEPVMEDFDEEVRQTVPDLNDDGSPKFIYGLRYGELAQFIMAGLAAKKSKAA